MSLTNRPIILIKIGGSLITDKNKPFSIRERALNIIAQEIKKASTLGKQLIIGHGAGAFAHVPAKKYQTHRGVINNDSYRGIAEVADVACQLNRIVVKKLLEKQVNAVAFSPLTMMLARKHQLASISLTSLIQALRLDLVPVVYGDQILDTAVGCTIFSTEKVLGYLALELKKQAYPVEKIIHCGQTNGVYDQNGQTIPLINSQNFASYQAALGGSNGVDVTGGMLHKVEETLALAKQGIPGLIIDGIEHGSLAEAISGQEVLGTKIEN